MSFKMTKYNLHIEMQIEFNAFFKDYHKKVKWSIEKGNVVLNDILARQKHRRIREKRDRR